MMATDGKGEGVDLGRLQDAGARAHALLAARPQQMRDEQADWNMRLDSWRDQVAPLLDLVRQTLPPLVDGRRVSMRTRTTEWIDLYIPIDADWRRWAYPDGYLGLVRIIIGDERVEPGRR